MTDEQVASEQDCLREALTRLLKPFARVTQDAQGEWVASYHDEHGATQFTLDRGDLLGMHTAAHQALDSYDALAAHYGRLRRAACGCGGAA